ncbi:TPM domain-containing protein [Cellulomonas cellasea]|uniref:Exonuclease VII small subunit n=1 Tax=Cellulomonas cellasea TaxID=43670 RepID=A0A7W4UHG0_9CELL|nr:TPM domain-containing protein [Cellulomonas cellasea]MBB2924237.1 exonuclease VII small subunit [Cellulomonas cellasea]
MSHRRVPDPSASTPELTRAAPAPWITRAAAACAVLLGLLAALGPASPAAAVEPLNVPSRITDQVGALSGSTAEVEASLDRLSEDTAYDLFVVFVDGFSGREGEQWARETAAASGLGAEDVILAVAVDDRRYGMWVQSAGEITEDEATRVRVDLVEPRLAAGDWAGAAVAAADGLRDAALGTGTAASGGGGGFGTVLVIGLVVVLGILVVRSLVRRRSAAGKAGAQPAGAAPQGLAALPTPELNRRASQALVAIDDALTTSAQELGFAQAQFGLEATRQFGAALEEARARVSEAFRWRQQLDDSTPETEPQARQIMIAIIETCQVAADSLDAHTDEFEKMRDLQARAPQVLDDAEQRATEVAARVEPARATVAQLATTYPAAALASVTPNPDQASALLAGAHESVARGREALTADDRGAAVGAARAAQDAVAQAVTLLDAVDRAGQDLARAGTDLTAAIASISADFADAERLAPREPAVQAAVQAGRAAASAAEAARTGGDPLAALRDVRAAEARLDETLEPFRERAEHEARARAQLDDQLGRLASHIRAVHDYIETRRGAVGPEARTRLSEAARLAQQAHRDAATDATGALSLAHRAGELANEAQQLAQLDVQDWEDQRRQRSGYGGFGGGGSNVGGMVLGGILLDSLLRGGGGGFGGGGFGGGGFGGGGGGGGDGGGFGGGGRF